MRFDGPQRQPHRFRDLGVTQAIVNRHADRLRLVLRQFPEQLGSLCRFFASGQCVRGRRSCRFRLAIDLLRNISFHGKLFVPPLKIDEAAAGHHSNKGRFGRFAWVKAGSALP